MRFAPSPTGLLHVGNARTALFNWLFARHHGGRFILRLEDTDLSRQDPVAERGTYVSLKWLGLFWDEGPVRVEGFVAPGPGEYGPYRQSERLFLYAEYLERLKDKGLVYPCFCTPEELEAERREQARQGLVYRYSGRCSRLSREEIQEKFDQGRVPAWRFRTGLAAVSWQDLVRGKVEWSAREFDDFIILRPNGRPTYNFAAVVDDHLMEITHVIRGDDHLANTPKQLLLYRGLGWEPPAFAHLPLLTGPDHKPLAKRHGVSSLDDLYQQGFLPAAIVNYLALLGWSSPSGREIMDLEALVQEFSLERVNKSPAIFDRKKLLWMNGKYIRALSTSELLHAVQPYLRHAGYQLESVSEDFLLKALALIQDSLSTLAEASAELQPFLRESVRLTPEARTLLAQNESQQLLRRFLSALSQTPGLEPQECSHLLTGLCHQTGVTTQKLCLPLRAALTGRLSGPDLSQIMAVLGKERIERRIKNALEPYSAR